MCTVLIVLVYVIDWERCFWRFFLFAINRSGGWDKKIDKRDEIVGVRFSIQSKVCNVLQTPYPLWFVKHNIIVSYNVPVWSVELTLTPVTSGCDPKYQIHT